MAKLSDLLYFKDCKLKADFQIKFQQLANHVFEKCTFEYNTLKFRIVGLEAGFFLEGIIEDKINMQEIQARHGLLYVQKRGDSFKGRKRIGLDITCGYQNFEEVDVFGTVLITAIEILDKDDWIPVLGPSRVLNCLLEGSVPKKNEGEKWTFNETAMLSELNGSSLFHGPLHLLSETEMHEGTPEFENRKHISGRDELDVGQGFRATKSIKADSTRNIEPTQTIKINSDIVKPIVNFIPTLTFLNAFLRDIGGLRINGKFFNSDSLIHLKQKSDLEKIESEPGCYFIFSTIEKEKIPCISADGFKCFNEKIAHQLGNFGCIYNGKSASIRDRIAHHLFSNHTPQKVSQRLNKNLSGTGGLSLDFLTEERILDLESGLGFKLNTNNLKPFKGFHKESSINSKSIMTGKYFLNGINIEEAQWSDHNFAVITITTDNELGKNLIEEGFALENGRPPLCKRFG